MQKTKFSILILVLLFTFTVNSFAQTDTSKIDLNGKWALQFGISHSFTLTNFDGATFSGKYHFTNNSAIRIGVTLGYNDKDKEISGTNILPDTTKIYDYDGNLSSANIRIALQYLHYLEMTKSISSYYGAGLYYFTRPYDENLEDYRLEKISYFGYGFDLLMGVEWFATSSIGVNAEYGLSFGYSYKEVTSERTYTYNDEKSKRYSNESGFALYSQRVKFGLSVYF